MSAGSHESFTEFKTEKGFHKSKIFWFTFSNNFVFILFLFLISLLKKKTNFEFYQNILTDITI